MFDFRFRQLGCVSLLTALFAISQPALSYERVQCESVNFRDNFCQIRDMDEKRVRLERQLSSSDCVRGHTWGSNRHGIWVRDGCRAEFRVFARDGHGGRGEFGRQHRQGQARPGPLYRVTCESVSFRTNDCLIPDRESKRIRLERQLSSADCIRGRTWGTNTRGIWVSDGCRADFLIADRDNHAQGHGHGHGHGHSDTLICSSIDGRQALCRVANMQDKRVRLQRQISGAACVRGYSWGTNWRGIWVAEGCRAEFSVTKERRNDRYRGPYHDRW